MSSKSVPPTGFDASNKRRPDAIDPRIETPAAWPNGADHPNIITVHGANGVLMRARTTTSPQSHMHYEVGFGDGINSTTHVVCVHDIDVCISFLERLKAQIIEEDAQLPKINEVRAAQASSARSIITDYGDFGRALAIVCGDIDETYKSAEEFAEIDASAAAALPKIKAALYDPAFSVENITRKQYDDALVMVVNVVGEAATLALAASGMYMRHKTGRPQRTFAEH